MAGLTLARRGVSTVLLDKKVFPRDKPCGGGIRHGVRRCCPEGALQRLTARRPARRAGGSVHHHPGDLVARKASLELAHRVRTPRTAAVARAATAQPATRTA